MGAQSATTSLICPGVVAQRRPETNMDEKEIALRKIATKGGESR